MQHKPIIIIGTGLAGYNLAKEFRKLDTTTPLQLFTRDHGRYYSKPVLSTALTQRKQPAELALADAATMQQRLHAEIFTEVEVDAIDPQAGHITVAQQLYPYSKLVFACGAQQIKPPISGDGVSEACSINNLQQYTQFHRKLTPQQHIAIIGAGFIGCEFANDLRNAGYIVSVIADSAYPLNRLIPRTAGQALQNALTQAGVTWYLNKTVTRIDKDPVRGFLIQLQDGASIAADNVLMAVGLRANTALASAAGIATQHGIITNDFLATNINNIYALGDCAEIAGKLRQFVAPINYCVKALAKTLAGQATTLSLPPMPISVKTPACPIHIVAPTHTANGNWQFEAFERNGTALFYDNKQQLQGFVLTGSNQLKMRQQLLLQLGKATTK